MIQVIFYFVLGERKGSVPAIRVGPFGTVESAQQKAARNDVAPSQRMHIIERIVQYPHDLDWVGWSTWELVSERDVTA